jgi:hypothetical protein
MIVQVRNYAAARFPLSADGFALHDVGTFLSEVEVQAPAFVVTPPVLSRRREARSVQRIAGSGQQCLRRSC